jgi:Transposase DDE domain group 1
MPGRSCCARPPGQAGLTAQLSGAMRVPGSSPLLDRGIVLVPVAVAIALGATSMSDIMLLAHLTPLLGTAPSGPAVRRALDLAGDRRTRDRIARARARARSRAWDLVWQASCGFPWLEVAGKTLTGWVVIDMDATLITAHSPAKENAAPTCKKKKGYGFHPLGAWCRNTRECLAMKLRPGNAGSNTPRSARSRAPADGRCWSASMAPEPGPYPPPQQSWQEQRWPPELAPPRKHAGRPLG